MLPPCTTWASCGGAVGLPSCPLVEYQTAMESTLSGRMCNERFSATSKDVVKSETTLMVLFTAGK